MRAAQQGDVDEVCGGRAYNAQIIIRLHEKSKIRNNAQTPPPGKRGYVRIFVRFAFVRKTPVSQLGTKNTENMS